MTDGCVHLLYNSSWNFHQHTAGQLLSGQLKRRVRPVHTYKITLAGELSSSPLGGPPCWASPLAFGLIVPNRARICKRLWSPGIDSEESIPPAYVAWPSGTTNRAIVLARKAGNRFMGSLKGLQIRAQISRWVLMHMFQTRSSYIQEQVVFPAIGCTSRQETGVPLQ